MKAGAHVRDVCFQAESGLKLVLYETSLLSHFRKFVMPAEEAVYRIVATSRSNLPRLPCRGTCFGKSCGGSMNCDQDPLRRRPRKSTAR